VKHILIVEDDHAIRKMEERLLESAGYQTSQARSAEVALELLASGPVPDLALVDVMMPGLSGLELSRRLKDDERLRGIPIIFVTARADAESMNAGFKAGGVLYLAKPFNSQKLLEMVKAILGA
jgi:two-component system phosphate regulon response regulator PhoB